MTEIILDSDVRVRPIAQLGGDWMVIAAARVSENPVIAEEWAKDERNAEERSGLIHSLVRHKHGSTLEHGQMIFFAHAPLFVFYEWHRHRIGFSYNEESGRYRKLEPRFWVPRRERPMTKVKDFKPMRPEFVRNPSDGDYEYMVDTQRNALADAWAAYEWELSHGIASEVARRHLPVSVYKSMWVTCNPRSMMKFLELRTHEPDAMFTSWPQLEIEECARLMEAYFAKHWPITYEAFDSGGRVAP